MQTYAHAPRLLLTLLLSASLLTACNKPDSATQLAQAREKLALGDTKTAMIQLKNAVATDGKNAEARYELGMLYFDQPDFPSAEKEFRRAREAGYAANIVTPMIARAILAQGDYQRMLDELPEPAENSAETATLQAQRATAELGLGRKDDARKTLQRAAKAAPDNVDVQLVLAQLALAEGDAEKAMQSLNQALQIAPKHRDSLLLKADLLRALKKPDEATALYRTVLQIAPRNIDARLALANIALTSNKLDEARKEVDAALTINPGNLQTLYTQALIDFREKKTERARDHLAQVLKAAPGFVPALLLGGSIEYTLGNLQTAESYLNKVVKVTPGNLYALRLLAASQLRLDRPDDAARTLASALKSTSPDAGVLVVAGEIALAKKDYAQASAYFEQASQRNPDSAAIRTELGIARLAQGDSRAMSDLQVAAGMDGADSRAGTFIILTQLKNKEFDAALSSIAELEKKQPATPLTWNYRGAAYLGKQDTVRAHDSFSQALKLDPAFFPAAANLAQLDLKNKQPTAARKRFESILKADPKQLSAMLALADLSLLGQDEKQYLSWLEKAAATQPEAVQPRVALARYHLAKGDKNKALTTAREAVNAQPDNPAALELLGTTQLALGDARNAISSYQKLIERQPGQAALLIKLATAQIMAKDLPNARKTLQEALQIQPAMTDAQLMLGRIAIQEARFDDAQKLARQVQQIKPADPAGYMLEGDIAYTRKNYPAALAAFEVAQARQASGAFLIRQLYVFNALKRPAEGEARLVSWLAAHPQDVQARAALAENLIKRSQYPAAAEHYLILNKHYPENLVVLNNLAWSLFESKDPRALGFAEQALKLKPDNPAVLDTLGWILVQQGKSERGIKLLEQALSKTRDTGDIQYHYAAALAKSGDHTRARQELDQLIKSGLDFSQKAAALALLQTLNKGR